MIHLWAGMAKSGKSYHAYQNCKNWLIVPEQYTLEAEKQLIEKMNLAGLIDIEVISFKRLIYKVMDEVGYPSHVAVGEMGKMMLLRKQFMKEGESLKWYKNAERKPGFLKKVYQLIQDMKQNRLSPEQVKSIGEAMTDVPMLKLKLDDLYQIYLNYEQEHAASYLDEEDLFEYTLEAIPKCQKIQSLDIWIDGFDGFTVQELAIIRGLAQQAKNVHVTLCLSEDYPGDLFRWTRDTLKKIEKEAREWGIPYEIHHLNHEHAQAEIHHLALNLASYPYSVWQGEYSGETVFCWGALTKQSEVERCAMTLLETVREKGYRWEEMAVVTADIENYETTIQRVFSLYDIPFFIDSKHDVMTNPLIRFILSLAQLIQNPRDLKALSKLLKTDLLAVDQEALMHFELYIQTHGVTLKDLEIPFTELSPSPINIEYANQVREGVFHCLSPYQKKTKSKQKVKKHVESLYEVLTAQKIDQRMDEKSKYFETIGDYEHVQDFTQVWNALIRLMDEMVAMMGEEVVSYSEFTEILETGLETIEVGRLPLNPSHVLVGSLDRSKAHPIKCLWILGFNDGLIPKRKGEEALIENTEKQWIQEKGISFLPDEAVFSDREHFNLYMALSRPSDCLYLSFARSDLEGTTLRPSHFLKRLDKIFHGFSIDYEPWYNEENEKVPFEISSQKATKHHLVKHLRRYADGHPVSQYWLLVWKWYKENHPAFADRILQALKYENQVTALKEEQVKALYNPPFQSSVSRLEEYVQCPFKFFVSSGLKPQSVKAYRIDYPDVGMMFHRTLELFGKQLQEKDLSWHTLSSKDQEQMIHQIVDQMTDTPLYKWKFQYQYLIQKLKRVSMRATKVLTQHLQRGTFNPTAFELAFARQSGAAPPVVVELPNGETIELRGVIDRVDCFEKEGKHYIKIIDYKSGKKEWSLLEMFYGLQMQLMVYLKACLGVPALFEANEIYPAGAFYFKIDDPIIESTDQLKETIEMELHAQLKLNGICIDDMEVLKHMDDGLTENSRSEVMQIRLKKDGGFTKDSKVVSMEELSQMVDWVELKIQEIGSALYDGDISIKPCRLGQYISCQYCDYSALCQFDPSFEGNDYLVKKVLDEETLLSLMGKGTKNVDS